MIDITNRAEFNAFFHSKSYGCPSESARRELLSFYTLVKEWNSSDESEKIEFPEEWLSHAPTIFFNGVSGAYDNNERALYYVFKNQIARIRLCREVIKEIV